MTFAPIAAAFLAVLCTSSWAVNKCTGADGKVSFQDAPCAGVGQSITIKPASGLTPAHDSTPKAAPQAITPVQAPQMMPPAAPPAPAPPAVTAVSQLQADADLCLAWYKPRLRDPRAAYHQNAKIENRVVTITIHATNGYGGYTTTVAACEIDGGKLDEAWTKTHARRRGWDVN